MLLAVTVCLCPPIPTLDRSFSTIPPVTFENINIATQNIKTLSCDVKLANSILEAKILHLDVLALQEVRHHETGTVESDSGDIKSWQFVWSGFKPKSEAGVALVLAPHVKLIESHVHFISKVLFRKEINKPSCGVRRVCNAKKVKSTHFRDT